jgi:type II secretory pathway component PulJ
VLQFLIVLAILAVVVIVVTAPLRSVSRSGSATPDDSTEIADLEAAREAKYREIRDAELDHSTGKLSDADFEALERTLRAEAVEILHALDRARRD